MAVRVFCSNPGGLLHKIKDAIQAESVKTWQVDSDGDFTHSPEQWVDKAWFRPAIQADRILFKILGHTGVVMSKSTYAVYHGRFIEMLLTHFDVEFTRVTATALPSDGDVIGNG